MNHNSSNSKDTFLWLEEIESEQALAWVRERNARTEAVFCDAAFETDRAQIYEIATRPDTIPHISRLGAHVYNFWQDAEQVRGLWRRTTLDEYRRDQPSWEILIDLDALAHEEGEDWVWRGCVTLEPEHRLGLVYLSRGGADANVVREFDLERKEFVPDGFTLPEAKGSAIWMDENTLLLNSALGGTTTSGYARTARLWKRGTPYADAPILFEGQLEDVYAGGSFWREPDRERTLFTRAITFEDSEHFLQNADGTLQKLDLPLDAHFQLHGDWLVLKLRSDWTPGARTFTAASLLAIRLSTFLEGSRDFQTLFEPSTRRILSGFSWTKSRLLLTVPDNLASQILLATPPAPDSDAPGFNAPWRIEPLAGVPESASINAWPLDGNSLQVTDDFLVSVSGFLTPSTLLLAAPGSELEALKRGPSAFDASGLEVTRHEAVSVDGEIIPYFQIGAEGRSKEASEPRPTLLYGYGGFEISLLPYYLGATGKVWLEEGGVYVVANIRGGGEFGPAWHKAGMREGKRLAHDDFAAVARDLLARGVTTPSLLAAHGGSNGGLLVGNMLTRYPELFGAIWCSVPLLDMKRYTQLLAGASWMSEYGDPDNDDDWSWMRDFSAYHNVEAGRPYPPILIVTARHDDRVHPAHARKMAARLEELGCSVWFYEPDDSGGHGAANKAQAARLSALGYAFLKRPLGNPSAAGTSPDD